MIQNMNNSWVKKIYFNHPNISHFKQGKPRASLKNKFQKVKRRSPYEGKFGEQSIQSSEPRKPKCKACGPLSTMRGPTMGIPKHKFQNQKKKDPLWWQVRWAIHTSSEPLKPKCVAYGPLSSMRGQSMGIFKHKFHKPKKGPPMGSS